LKAAPFPCAAATQYRKFPEVLAANRQKLPYCQQSLPGGVRSRDGGRLYNIDIVILF
jgi:hypothetical protein